MVLPEKMPTRPADQQIRHVPKGVHNVPWRCMNERQEEVSSSCSDTSIASSFTRLTLGLDAAGQHSRPNRLDLVCGPTESGCDIAESRNRLACVCGMMLCISTCRNRCRFRRTRSAGCRTLHLAVCQPFIVPGLAGRHRPPSQCRLFAILLHALLQRLIQRLDARQLRKAVLGPADTLLLEVCCCGAGGAVPRGSATPGVVWFTRRQKNNLN